MLLRFLDALVEPLDPQGVKAFLYETLIAAIEIMGDNVSG